MCPRLARGRRWLAGASDPPSEGDAAADGALLNPNRDVGFLRLARNLQRQYPEYVFLIQKGSFFEIYDFGGHLEEVSNRLGLKIARGQPPFAGFPVSKLDTYLRRFMAEQYRVAVVEQQNPMNGDGDHGDDNGGDTRPASGTSRVMPRRITRLLTPGTVTELDHLDVVTDENRFCLSVEPLEGTDELVALAWADLTTSEYHQTTLPLDQVMAEIQRLRPMEVMMHPRLVAPIEKRILTTIAHFMQHHGIAYVASPPTPPVTIPSEQLAKLFSGDPHPPGYDPINGAGHVLIGYFLRSLPCQAFHLSRLHAQRHRVMGVDANTLKTLGVLGEGQLYSELAHAAQTPMGKRAIRLRLTRPSNDLALVNRRLAQVQMLVEDRVLADTIRRTLAPIRDLPRATQTLVGRGRAKDVAILHVGLKQYAALMACLPTSHPPFDDAPYPQVDALIAATDLFDTRAADASSPSPKSGGSFGAAPDPLMASLCFNDDPSRMAGADLPIRYGVDPALDAAYDRLAVIAAQCVQVRTDLQAFLQLPQPPALMADVTYGVYVYVTASTSKAAADMKAVLRAASTGADATTPPMARATTTTGTDAADVAKVTDTLAGLRLVTATARTMRVALPRLSALREAYVACQQQVAEQRQQVFQRLRHTIDTWCPVLAQCAEILGELDTTQSFAAWAVKHGAVRPTMTLDRVTRIVGGRHPVVERNQQRRLAAFVANDCAFDDEHRMSLVMGPNMGGKSTYLRSVGLIHLMAQAGCYVPAAAATLGMADHLFSRIGSADDLAGNRSTFMVEMEETGHIVREATAASVCIFDEVGRGTSVEDGKTIAAALIDHLVHAIGCRTLFATHYLDLHDVLHSLDHIRCMHTALLRLPDGQFAYDYRIRPGIAHASYGLVVAQSAGIPAAIIERARSYQRKLGYPDAS
ncbi:hypothetical protein CXG81DRAFT_26603 [Caulochytrium protostelioides]|uniref:DNA mismatch repair proteins mutS family domain-containing protein n=1 Tax=Caulochytrium protostelioides TaxID=1555241 RepID=A0A4P9X6A4_9FUNG|nr:hypothetical protein CXG81DRAFT_26603 [Caulochytrium protostelioides]|eukprot:RKP00698.1 hypothetical protein CXG81DRAFT_26603 [Caulochytrium protostelioides]